MTRSKTPLARRHPLGTVTLVLLAAICWTPATGAEEGDDELRKHWRIDKFQWQGPIGENRGIEISNELGDIRTRLSSDDQVFVSAVIQRHENDPHQGDVRIGEKDGRMTIEPAFAAAESFDPEILTEGMEKRRIDVTVIVPLGVRLIAHTAKGLIEAKGLESDVEATSTSGDVVVSIVGSVRARTERGAIHATLRSAEWKEAPALETLTGDVTVWLPPDADAVVKAETSGLITTDYSIDIAREGAGEKKSATAKIGEGKRRLTIRSTKGSVRILKSPG